MFAVVIAIVVNIFHLQDWKGFMVTSFIRTSLL